ncbi:MAG TPA: sigma-54 dependent transcriptional regulator [Planctomycetia bacterium]|nr:sigma-54 dependent transcriptional regulator [Planctomycetia bacterium]
MTTTRARVAIIDDEESLCWTLSRALKREGFAVESAASAEEGLEAIARRPPDVVLIDIRLPGMDGLEACGRIKEVAPGAETIVMTAFGRLSTAVTALERGAFDYLSKPFDLDVAIDAVSRALAKAKSKPAESGPIGEDDLLGESRPMQEVFKRIALAARSDASVVILGESGVGKERVAAAIHRFSSRRAKPFLPVHIAALNPALVESELFGHAKGAFTGAEAVREGLMASAREGTVFLDEIGEIPAGVQVKLLRLLEAREFTPVGSNDPRPLSVRILAATHRDLPAQVAAGTFRQDLFYRLNVFEIRVPPLRERREDIRLLAAACLRRRGLGAVFTPPETLAFLEAQDWPGNVRELFNAIEHAAIVARSGPLLPEHFPRVPSPPKEGCAEEVQASVREWLRGEIDKGAQADLHESLLKLVEPPLLEEVMNRLRGNRLAAGKLLGLDRGTVRKKLVQYGLDAREGEGAE